MDANASPALDLKADLLTKAAAYCAGRGISLPRLATLVANDGKFFDRISNGGGMTTRMYERFIGYFDANPPPKKAEGNDEEAA